MLYSLTNTKPPGLKRIEECQQWGKQGMSQLYCPLKIGQTVRGDRQGVRPAGTRVCLFVLHFDQEHHIPLAVVGRGVLVSP